MKTRPFFLRDFSFGNKQVQNANNEKNFPKKIDGAAKLHKFRKEKQKIKTCSIQKY